MSTLLNIFLVWVLLSIPATLMVARFLSLRVVSQAE